MSAVSPLTAQERENEFLEGLRQRFEDQGFDFIIQPDRSLVPKFLKDFTPDAIATSPERKLVIEVKSRPARRMTESLESIRHLFEGQNDWELVVLYVSGDEDQTQISEAKPADILARLTSVRALLDQGHTRESFVMAWSLLEASLKATEVGKRGPARKPGTVVQALTMNGYIDASTANRLRSLIPLRNQIVHGDVKAEPSIGDVDFVLRVVESAMSIEHGD